MSGQVVVISGAAGGIGAAVVERFARSGASIVACDVSPTVHQLDGRGGATRAITLDATRADTSHVPFDVAVDAFARVDAFVHCAGVSIRKHVLELTSGDWDRVMAANATSAFYMAQAACKVMAGQRKGAIVLVSSQLAEVGRAEGSPYVAAKGAVRSLAMALAIDMAEFNVRVNCVGPGVTDTEMLGDRRQDDEVRNRWLQRIPLGRLATPADVAGAVAFLASEDAAYVTGTTLYVDGGYLAS